MSTDEPTADEVAELLLPLDGPYRPDRVVATARTISELVRRLGHATRHGAALRYPPQLYRTVGALRWALSGLEQTLHQLATRLDTFAADPRVEHDHGGDPQAACADAARQLRHAAAGLGGVTATRGPRRSAFPLPGRSSTVAEARPAAAHPATASDAAASTAAPRRPGGRNR